VVARRVQPHSSQAGESKVVEAAGRLQPQKTQWCTKSIPGAMSAEVGLRFTDLWSERRKSPGAMVRDAA
jgi:hypothetical protein